MELAPASQNPDRKRAVGPAVKFARAAAFCAAVAVAVLLAMRFVHVALNTSPSMPVGFYRTWDVDRAPRRGDIVTVCAPVLAAQTGARRGYIPRGSCDAATAPLIKYVAAAGGDTVAIAKSGVTVDGSQLPDSGALDRDGAGRPMRAYALALTRLKPGEIFLYAPQARSYDSRYFGPVPVARVRSFAAPLAVL